MHTHTLCQKEVQIGESGEMGYHMHYCMICLFVCLFVGWSFRSSVDIIVEVPIWLLGRCYHAEDKGECAVYTCTCVSECTCCLTLNPL